MSNLPRTPRPRDEPAAFILGLLTIIAGLAMISQTPLPPVSIWEYLVWALTLAAASNLGIVIETGEANFAHVVIVAAFLTLGLGPAAMITLAGVILGEIIRAGFPHWFNVKPRSRRRTLVVTASNLTIYGLSLLASGSIYLSIGGKAPLLSASHPVWTPIDWLTSIGSLAVLFATYLAVNYLLFALYLRLEGGASLSHYFRHNWRTIILLEVAPISFAAILAATALNIPSFSFAVFCVFLVTVMLITHNLSNASKRLEQRVRELASLSAVGQALANSLELPELLEAIHQQCTVLMEARDFYIALYNSDGEELVFPLSYEHGERTHYHSRPHGTRLIEYVIETRQPLLVRSDAHELLQQLAREQIGPMAQSWLGVPIMAGDEVLGVIAVKDPDHPDTYDEDDRDILAAIASQAAAAIHNAQMFVTVRHRAAELAILNSVSSAIASTLNLNKMLNIVVTSVGRVMGNQKAAIFLADDAGQYARLAASHGLSQEYIVQSSTLPIGPDKRLSAIVTRQPLIVTDVQTDPRTTTFRALAETEGFRSFADVPLQTPSQAIGTLTVYYAEPHRFSLAEIDLLNTFANQTSAAVVNAKLYARTDQALAARVEQLAALEEIGRNLSASLDFDQVIHRVLQRAMATAGASFGGVGILNADQQTIRITATHGYSPDVIKRFTGNSWPATSGVVGRAIRLGQPVRVDDVASDPDYVAFEASVRSEMVIPIQSEGKTLGVINLESTQVGRFEQQSLDFARQLATQAAIALQNAQIYGQAQSRLREMSILYSIGQQLTSILDVRQLGQELTRQMTQALNTTSCALELLRSDPDRLETIAKYFSSEMEHSPAALEPEPVYHLADYPATRAAIADHRPLIVYLGDPEADPLEIASLRRHDLHAMLTIALVAGNEVLGAVEWADERPERRFSPDELRLAVTLANQAAIAVQNAQLFEERSRRIRELSRLYEASLALTAGVELDEVLHRIGRVAREITGADVAALYLYNAASDTFDHVNTSGVNGGWITTDLVRRNGLTYRVIADGEPILIGDTHADERVNLAMIAAGVRSLICVPVISKAQPLGVLYVNSFTLNHFDQDNVQMVSALANQAAVAIESTRLFAGIAEGRDKLQAILNSTRDGVLMFDATTRIVTVNPRLEEMWDLSRAGLEGQLLLDLLEQPEYQIAAKMGFTPDALHGRLAQVCAGKRVEWPKEVFALPASAHPRFAERSGLPVLDAHDRLMGWMIVLRDVTEERELQQMRDNLTNMIVHDLRSPLSSILGGLQMIEETIGLSDPTSIERQALEISIHSTRKLLDLVNSLLDISRMTSGQALAETEPVALESIIDAAIERLSPLALEEGIVVRKQIQLPLPPVLIDEEKISRVLINLLDNALKFTPSSQPVTILAQRWAEPGDSGAAPEFVCCIVRDAGPGIPPEHREHIFDRFVQIDQPIGRRRGTGLGLSFCRLAVEAHGGKIWVDDAPGGGSDFAFTLPIATR